jgi:GT2 family glycosyltransferase
MPTAILDLEIESLPKELSVGSHYNKVFLLLRFKGKPIGKIILPVSMGCLFLEEHAGAIMDEVSPVLWKEWLKDYLQFNHHDINDYKPPRATVAICTRDRPDDLKRCLDALMEMPYDGQEFLVIDNCPATNASFDLVRKYPKVRYIREDFPGSSAARNRALYEAKNEIVAFTDDDATPDKGWLRALLANFHDPRVICVTGQVMPLELENEAQEWFETYSPLGRGFQRVEYDGGAFYNRFCVAPIGVSANMALHRKILENVGAFDEVLGVGTPTCCGEDHELFSRILGKGYKIIYEPTALSWHRHRKTRAETKKTLYGYGVGVYAFWTRTLLKEKELAVLSLPWKWFYYDQMPNIIKGLLRKSNSLPIDLVLAELKGCYDGVAAYFKSRKMDKLKRKKL